LSVAACPGTQSKAAGKVSACQGCPNQKLCASGAPSAPNPGQIHRFIVELILNRVANKKYIFVTEWWW